MSEELKMAKQNSTKSAAIVFGALAFGWLAIEMALKPWLVKARSAMNDPDADPDDADKPLPAAVDGEDDAKSDD